MIYDKGFYAMGTRLHAVFPEMNADVGFSTINRIKNEVDRIESILSWFDKNSEVSKVNRLASREPVKISTELFEALKICQNHYTLTKGAFNIAVRPLLQFWNSIAGDASSETDLKTLLAQLDMKYIVLDDSDRSVKFVNDDIEIDFGGFGKGYALENIIKILKNSSIDNAFISFGESSVLTRGSHPGGNYWKVGIKNYYNSSEALHTFHMNDGSVSTSSNFYIDDQGELKNHRHVINPFTGYPVDEMVTVSVSAESAIVAEILSTAFLVLSDVEIEAITSKSNSLSTVKVTYNAGKPVVNTFN